MELGNGTSSFPQDQDKGRDEKFKAGKLSSNEVLITHPGINSLQDVSAVCLQHQGAILPRA